MRNAFKAPSLPAFLMITIFAGSRLIFASSGVHFDATTIDRYWQYLDRPWLETDLLRSLFYLHSQPPAFNLFLGVVIKLAPGDAAKSVFHALFLLLSLAGYFLSFGLFRRMGAATVIALAAATLMILTPAWILFENWLIYDLPVLVLLVAAAYALVRHGMAPIGDRFWLVAFSSLLLTVSLIRSGFDVIWIALLGIVFATMGRHGRRLAVAMTITAALAALPSLKNKIVFGKFSPSTWFGMNLANVVQQWWLPEDLEKLAAAGAISQVSLVIPFSPLSQYPVALGVPPAFERVPALATPVKASGVPNYNHFAYIGLSDAYLRDAEVLIRRNPFTTLRSIGNGIDRFMRPGSVQGHVGRNRAAIARYDSIWNRIVFGLVQVAPRKNVYVLLIFGTIAGIAFGAWAATGRNDLNANADRGRMFGTRFMMLTIIFVTVVGNVFGRGENHRFRVYLSPFIVTFLAQLGGCIVTRFRRRSSTARSD